MESREVKFKGHSFKVEVTGSSIRFAAENRAFAPQGCEAAVAAQEKGSQGQTRGRAWEAEKRDAGLEKTFKKPPFQGIVKASDFRRLASEDA